MGDGSAAPTFAEDAALKLRRDILSGALVPGSQLGVRMLTERYGIGPTPIREALSRMSETGLIHLRGRQGFAVTALDRDDLADVIWLRRQVETQALGRAMQKGDLSWEADIMANLHQLRRVARDVILSDDVNAAVDLAFDAVHKQFHTSLIAACGAKRLLVLAGQLYDEMFRYRRLAMRTKRWTKDVVTEHERLAELVLARDSTALTILDEHISDVMAMVFPEPTATTSQGKLAARKKHATHPKDDRRGLGGVPVRRRGAGPGNPPRPDRRAE